MAKYNFHELDKDGDGYWAVLHAVAEAGELGAKDVGSENISITLVVEGKELDFLDFIDRYIKVLDELVEHRARAMIGERFDKAIAGIEEAHADLKDLLLDTFQVNRAILARKRKTLLDLMPTKDGGHEAK